MRESRPGGAHRDAAVPGGVESREPRRSPGLAEVGALRLSRRIPHRCMRYRRIPTRRCCWARCWSRTRTSPRCLPPPTWWSSRRRRADARSSAVVRIGWGISATARRRRGTQPMMDMRSDVTFHCRNCWAGGRGRPAAGCRLIRYGLALAAPIRRTHLVEASLVYRRVRPPGEKPRVPADRCLSRRIRAGSRRFWRLSRTHRAPRSP